TGWIRHNLIGSGLGLVVTLVVGWSLIPVLGLDGAALTASFAYCTSLLYQLIIFMRRTSVPFLDLLPHTGDVRKARSMWYIH
ncbi:MAG TPA: polysaccharide biosynthesis C-terminal domain-containing protein, partial [Flavobacteriales bacterium]|nr:polysaccharide biosynthesis C-terminal domain-containing protein [Flavobacteriales bacterium]